MDVVLFTGTDMELPNVDDAMRTFRAGATDRMALKTPIVFPGLLLELCSDGAITLSQTQYALDLKKITVADHLTRGQIKCQKALRATPRQALGH